MGKPRERDLIRHYVVARYPERRVILGCPLGPVPERLIATWGARKALRVGRGLRPEVDALIFEDSKLVLIEAKILKWLDGLAKLTLYKSLIPSTPELQEYRDWPVEMVLCTPWSMESIEEAARASGIRIDVFITTDIQEYVEELGKYWTSDYKARREERKRAREALGLD
ncbi:MAG: hypothetical protein KKB38_21040 [Gammaproteobacteria bacterium]|nr:hypothetical protein [Gammaproteobacteria bacterium]